MLHRFMRSPLVPLLLFIGMIGCSIITLVVLQNKQLFLYVPYLLAYFGFLLFWTIMYIIYNKKYPADRIKYLGLIPTEFREYDEGQRWITDRACRNVYIYYTSALPAAAVIFCLYSEARFLPLVILGVLGLGQYLVYWLTIRQLNKIDLDE